MLSKTDRFKLWFSLFLLVFLLACPIPNQENTSQAHIFMWAFYTSSLFVFWSLWFYPKLFLLFSFSSIVLAFVNFVSLGSASLFIGLILVFSWAKIYCQRRKISFLSLALYLFSVNLFSQSLDNNIPAPPPQSEVEKLVDPYLAAPQTLYDYQQPGTPNVQDLQMAPILKQPLKKLSLEEKDQYRLNKNSLQNDTVKTKSKTTNPLNRIFTLSDINSCGTIDSIPWTFKDKGKKVRVLIQDQFFYQNEDSLSEWQIHQVMNKYEEVSFIFRRKKWSASQKKDYYEIFKARGKKVERLLQRDIDDENSLSTEEEIDLSSLYHKTAISFTQANGNSVSYTPKNSFTGAITFKQNYSQGATIMPVIIEGSGCSRPEDNIKIGINDSINVNQKGSSAPPSTKTPSQKK